VGSKEKLKKADAEAKRGIRSNKWNLYGSTKGDSGNIPLLEVKSRRYIRNNLGHQPVRMEKDNSLKCST